MLTNQIDFGLNVQEAGDASRWQHEGDNEPTGEKMTQSGGYVEVESGIPYETVRELRKKGHDVRFDVGGYGGYQAIKVEMHDGQRVYVGASESRKDGMAAGYWFARLREIFIAQNLFLLRLELGELFLRVGHVRFLCDTELKEFLLTT